ncbi:SGNH/GDSL hydrolase family protein [bacterium]|nr:SGNH/GDSL hydrolase family protein [bacterium]
MLIGLLDYWLKQKALKKKEEAQKETSSPKVPPLSNKVEKRIYLLGDSIIDNTPYVQKNEKDVVSHLNSMYKSSPQINIYNRAVDGHTMKDLLDTQLSDEGLNEATNIVVSIGGNDLLGNLYFLIDAMGLYQGQESKVFQRTTTRNKSFEDTYFEIIKPMQQEYESIVANLSNYRAKLLLCTVYEGDLVDTDEFNDVIYSSKTMLSIFNDIVYRTAQKYNAEVLELRDIFVSPEDYANPIEPSHIGGEKLAKAIKGWVDSE